MKGIRLLHIGFQQSCRKPHLCTVRELINTILLNNQINILQKIDCNDRTGQSDHKALGAVKMQPIVEHSQIPGLLNGLWVRYDIDKRHKDRDTQKLQKASDHNRHQQQSDFSLIFFCKNISQLGKNTFLFLLTHGKDVPPATARL